MLFACALAGSEVGTDYILVIPCCVHILPQELKPSNVVILPKLEKNWCPL